MTVDYPCEFAATAIWEGDAFFLTMVWALNLYFHLLPPLEGIFPRSTSQAVMIAKSSNRVPGFEISARGLF